MNETRVWIGLLAASVLGVTGCVEPGHGEADWMFAGRSAEVEVHTRTAPDAESLSSELRRSIEATAVELDIGNPESEPARINTEAADGYYRLESHDLWRLIFLAREYAKLSGGAYDPTVGPLNRLYTDGDRTPRLPRAGEIEVARGAVGWQKLQLAHEARALRFAHPGMRLDLSGLADGFALDIASRAFARPGTDGGRLRLGNSYYAWGAPPRREVWSVTVADPRRPERELLRLDLSGRGVAACAHLDPQAAGSQEARRRLILDPRSGSPASGLLAAVAVADTAADAAAASSAIFVLGFKGAAEMLTELRNVQAVVLVDGEDGPYLLVSGSLEGSLTPSADLEKEIAGRVRYLLPPERR